MTAADWIDNLERKAKAATPGPWSADGYGGGQQVTGATGTIFADTLTFHEDAEFIAAANPATILRLIEDLRRTKSGARTLGRIIEQQNRDALDASGMHHVVDETGDGDWEVVWEALALLRPERDALAARLAAVEDLADETERAGDPLLRLDRLRAALSTAPTDTTKEN